MEMLTGLDLGTVVTAVPVIGVLFAWLGSERARANRERENNDSLERAYRAALREAAGMSSEESQNGAK